MQIERGAVNTIPVMARVTLSPSYWLLWFRDPERNASVYCIADATNTTGGMVTLRFTETNTPTALDGEVTLSPAGNWELKVYEQTSVTNLSPALAQRVVTTIGLFVHAVDAVDSGWSGSVGECPECPDECDPTTVNGTESDTPTITVLQGGVNVGTLNPATGVHTVPECDPCEPCDPLFITINGEEASEVSDPCGQTVEFLVVDSESNPVSVTLNRGSIVVDALPCAEPEPCDPLTFDVYNSDLTLLETGSVADPCGFNLEIGVQDTLIQRKDSAGNNIGSIIALPSAEAADVTCPDATVTFDGLPFLSVRSNATQNIDCSTRLDAAYAVDGGAVTGTYTLSGTANGRNVYRLDVNHSFQYSGTRWELIKTGADYLAAVGAETYPWQADWSATAVTVTQSTIGGVCEDCPPGDAVTIQLVDTAAANIGIPDVYAPGTTTTKTAPDGSVTIRNSVPTTLHTVAVKSNGSATQDIADSTITRPDGTTVGLAATVALDVRDYRSGIAYNFGRILHSGQTTSYRTGDEGTDYANGFFDYTRPVYPTNFAELGANFTTLAANNIHGNTTRFTDRAGAAAATSGNRFIQDHLTGLEWYVLGTLPTAAAWNSAVDAGVAINATLGETGWTLPSEKVQDSITNDELSSALNYAPFNINTSLWTGTTRGDDTTFARRYVTPGSAFGNSAKTATFSWIYVRRMP